jgi:hypothetical protein
MPMRMASPLLARVTQVLQDRLPAELDLIDAEESATTPDIPNGQYYQWDRKFVPQYPAVTMEMPSIEPIVEARPDSFGRRLHAQYLVRVKVHAQSDNSQADNALQLQKLIHRYVAGIFRVLCIMYNRLETIADPVAFVSIVNPGGAITLGPEIEQEDAVHIIRTGSVPVLIRQIEARG